LINEKERQSDKDTMDILSKANNPGKLKKESEWTDWLVRFRSYLSSIPGIIGVPLSYVIRDEATPDDADRHSYPSHREKCIARARLEGPFYKADAVQVHMYLMGFVQGESAEQWLKDKMKLQDGRVDILTLKAHYGGVGNVTRRLADADNTYQNLYYKAEKSMPFERFLNKAQDMWNIYEENNQSYNEVAKIRWLFQQVKSTDENVISTIAACRHQFRKDDDSITYAEAAEQIAAAISEATTTKLTRSISSVSRSTRGQKPAANAPGEKKLDFISNEEWNKMSFEKRAKIRDERDKKGLPGGNRTFNKRKGSFKDKGAKRNVSKTLSESEERVVNAIGSVVVKAVASSAVSASSEITETPPTHDAGNAFGGQKDVQRKKQS
jgi:hypothetical protein